MVWQNMVDGTYYAINNDTGDRVPCDRLGKPIPQFHRNISGVASTKMRLSLNLKVGQRWILSAISPCSLRPAIDTLLAGYGAPRVAEKAGAGPTSPARRRRAGGPCRERSLSWLNLMECHPPTPMRAHVSMIPPTLARTRLQERASSKDRFGAKVPREVHCPPLRAPRTLSAFAGRCGKAWGFAL